MRLLDVCVDEQAVHLRVDVLHGDLETVEEARLGHLNLGAEALHQVLVDDAVGGSEEGQHVGDEVALIVLEAFPVIQVLGEVHLTMAGFVNTSVFQDNQLSAIGTVTWARNCGCPSKEWLLILKLQVEQNIHMLHLASLWKPTTTFSNIP